MSFSRKTRACVGIGLVALLASCGLFSGTSFSPERTAATTAVVQNTDSDFHGSPSTRPRGRLTDLFSKSSDPNTSVRVNKYIWNAALDVLNFLPIESVDPFTGVIVTGYGTPPGGGRAYRATIYVQDPALDARSLNIAMETQGGHPVSVETVRAVEDAILTRARQMRIQDGKL